MIQFIEQSLTKYVVDQVQLKFKYASVELREPAAADEYHHVAGGASKNGKKALTQPLLSSVTEVEAIGMPIGDSINQTDIVQLNTFLLDLAMSNQERLTKLDQSALSIVINKMAIDICSKRFFHPIDLDTEQQKLVANKFIEFIKHELRSSKPMIPVDSEQFQVGLTGQQTENNKYVPLINTQTGVTNQDEIIDCIPTNWFNFWSFLFDFRFCYFYLNHLDSPINLW